MPRISIIIPVYNVEKYICRCLDSLLAQSFSDFELLCIDDGSTDNSGEICEQYADKDARIKVFHIPNQGVGNARNYGLSMICGEWFAFVDSDDWVEPNYLEILYNNAIKYDCMISAVGFQRNTEYCLGYDVNNMGTVVIESADRCICNFICSVDSMEGVSWNKLYRADVFKDIKFDCKVKVNEDCLYIYEVMSRCEKACYCRAKLYHWFFRSDSACHSKKIEKDFQPANVFLKLYNDTLVINNETVSRVLKRNYIASAIKVLLYAKYEKSDEEVSDARKRCKMWKNDVWNSYTAKEKFKYIVAIYFARLARICI